ncbi:erythrocyte vesicle protein 1, putative [Plasmodium vinckei brucechwatti]|uniref:Erythrocyte vesicle protein 1, putative n=1 Tax=Plasmodium vinckei brucechwatti TaxID=119398 RepID=A0A6V7S1A5_PLAVN|nr:erythrocyte vesicle protein 1, putative [Plasmodium vinckei brucechwatti]
MNHSFVILFNFIFAFGLKFDTYVLLVWTNEAIQHRLFHISKLNRTNRILSSVKSDTSDRKKTETKSSSGSQKKGWGKKSHKKKESSSGSIEKGGSELKTSTEYENTYTDTLLSESSGPDEFVYNINEGAIKKYHGHSSIFNCFTKLRSNDDDDDSYKQKDTNESNLKIKSSDNPDEGKPQACGNNKGNKYDGNTNPHKLDADYLTRKKSSIDNYEINLETVTKIIDSNQKIIERENHRAIKDNTNKNSNTVRSRDMLLNTSARNIDTFFYDKIVTHLLGYAYIFYGHKTNIKKLEKALIKDYYYNYKVLKDAINRIPDEFKYSQNINIYDSVYSILDHLGIEKYYYGFNRNLHTFLFLAREFLQKEHALIKVYESLPIDFEFDRKELKEQIQDSTSDEMNIYDFSYKMFDPICNFLHTYNCFNLNYISNKLINNLHAKNSNAVIAKELSKLTEYAQATHSDIIEYLKDLTCYITNLFEYGHRENLFNELVIFCYSLFFDYYIDTLDKLLDRMQVHLDHPFNERIKNELSIINVRIKVHRDFVENEMVSFYRKYNISENLLECVTSIFSNNTYRVSVLQQYLDSRYSNYLSLILLLFRYLKVFIFSMSTYSNLQIAYSLLLDLEKKKVKYDEALNILTQHASFNIFDSEFFNKKSSNSTSAKTN